MDYKYTEDESTKFDFKYELSDHQYNELKRKIYNESSGRIKLDSKSIKIHNFNCLDIGVLNRSYACSPRPDLVFEPCENIVGYPVLSYLIWIILTLAIGGNIIIVSLFIKSLTTIRHKLSGAQKISKFLQLNLAIGDLCMGIYLTSLAIADYKTSGKYYNWAIEWQHLYGCKIVGPISVFASQLSTFILIVITVERFLKLLYPLHKNLHLSHNTVIKITALGWLYSMTMALLPIFFDINSYSKTSICVPIRIEKVRDRVYLWFLLVFNIISVLIVSIGYLMIFYSVITDSVDSLRIERKLAARMGSLIVVNFICLIPLISVGGITFVLNKPMIKVTQMKMLVVVFYPINSVLNPFLYGLRGEEFKTYLALIKKRFRCSSRKRVPKIQQPRRRIQSRQQNDIIYRQISDGQKSAEVIIL